MHSSARLEPPQPRVPNRAPLRYWRRSERPERPRERSFRQYRSRSSVPVRRLLSSRCPRFRLRLSPRVPRGTRLYFAVIQRPNGPLPSVPCSKESAQPSRRPATLWPPIDPQLSLFVLLHFPPQQPRRLGVFLGCWAFSTRSFVERSRPRPGVPKSRAGLPLAPS